LRVLQDKRKNFLWLSAPGLRVAALAANRGLSAREKYCD
jgi:hypothetical protein